MYCDSGAAIFKNQILLLVDKYRSLYRDPWAARLKRCCVQILCLTLLLLSLLWNATRRDWIKMAKGDGFDHSFHAFPGPTAATSKNRSLSKILSSLLNIHTCNEFKKKKETTKAKQQKETIKPNRRCQRLCCELPNPSNTHADSRSE